jgi:hypothetical protein
VIIDSIFDLACSVVLVVDVISCWCMVKLIFGFLTIYVIVPFNLFSLMFASSV